MTRYLKWPKGVLNALFHSSPALILTNWYVFRRSNLVKIVSPCRSSKAEMSSGRGYLFFTVILLRPW